MKYYLFTCQGNRDVGRNVYTADCSNHSPLDLVSIFRCPSSPRNPVYSRRVEQRSVCKGCGSWVVEEADQWLVELFTVNAQQNKKKSTKKKMTKKNFIFAFEQREKMTDIERRHTFPTHAKRRQMTHWMQPRSVSQFFCFFRLKSRLSFDSQRMPLYTK